VHCRFCLEGDVRFGTVSLLTFVSFEAGAPKDSEPPGLELAEQVAASLRARGFELQGPDEHEGWAWSFGTAIEGGGIFSVLGLTDDPPIEWQVHSYGQRGRPRLFGGAKVEQLEARMREWLAALDAGLQEADGISNIRWYDQATFDADHGATWYASPLD